MKVFSRRGLWVSSGGLVAIAAFGLTWYAAAGSDICVPGNMAPNPSAEKVDERGRPVGWGHYQNTPDEWGATGEEFCSGKRAAFLRITAFGDGGYACTGLAVGRTDGYSGPEAIAVKPGTTYHFSFWLAGYGFRRKITIKPWWFRLDGSGRDRSMKGISVLPTREWKHYTGSFTTKAERGRVVLIIFVYGLEGRDIEQGATLFVDDVYLGTAKPPAPVPPAGRRQVRVPEKPAPIKGQGYKPWRGKVRLWELCTRYGGGLSMSFVGWTDRDKWALIPYGELPETVEHDMALEGPTFFLNITWRPDSYISGPVLYRKPAQSDPRPPRHNLLYRGWYTPGGLWAGGANLGYIRVLKNTPEEIIVRSAGRKSHRDKHAVAQVVADYVVRSGKPWLEVVPVSQCSTIGMHGETRIVVFPEAGAEGGDFVYDALLDVDKDKTFNRLTGLPAGFRAKMLLDYVMDDDNLWVLIPTPVDPQADPDSNRMPLEYRQCRFMLSNQVDGYHAGWSEIGEGRCKRVVSAPYAFFLGRRIIIAHLRPGYWHYQRIGRQVRKGESVAVSWRVAYRRKWSGFPFEPGGKWHPLYPGQWRLVCRIDGRYFTLPVALTAAEVNHASLTFKSPATGNLQYVVFYLYDRTDDTSKGVWTPMDIYRTTQLASIP